MSKDFSALDEFVKGLNTPAKAAWTQNKSKQTECSHANVTREEGRTFCRDCGMEIMSGPSTQHIREKARLEPNRCQIRKQDEKGIWKDVERHGFSDSIIRSANKIFMDTTKGRIYRGNSRS